MFPPAPFSSAHRYAHHAPLAAPVRRSVRFLVPSHRSACRISARFLFYRFVWFSSRPLIISSGSSHSSPLSYLITERRRWCLSFFKQATTTWRSLGSSSHPIISSHPRHGASRPPSRLMRLVGRLVPIYRVINEGRDENEASKRTRKNGEGTGTRNRGVGRGEGRNEDGKTTGNGRTERGGWQAKQGKGQRGHAAITRKNKTPLIPFRPTPSPQVLIYSPVSISPPPPGRGMR